MDNFMQYVTDYSVEDCMGLMMRENIYDVFRYTYQKCADNILEIVIDRCYTRTHGNIRSCYRIVLERGQKTIISVMFLRQLLFSIRLPEKWMDEFMKQKLEAEIYME